MHWNYKSCYSDAIVCLSVENNSWNYKQFWNGDQFCSFHEHAISGKKTVVLKFFITSLCSESIVLWNFKHVLLVWLWAYSEFTSGKFICHCFIALNVVVRKVYNCKIIIAITTAVPITASQYL